MRNRGKTQINLPVTLEERAEIHEAAKARGISQSQFLREAAKMAMLGDFEDVFNDKTCGADHEAPFESRLGAANEILTRSIRCSLDGYLAVLSKIMSNMMADNQALCKANEDLQNRLKDAETRAGECERFQNEAAMSGARADALAKRVSELEAQLTMMKEHYGSEITAMESRHSAEIARVYGDAMQQIMAGLQDRNGVKTGGKDAEKGTPV